MQRDVSLSHLRVKRARSILVADQPFYGIVGLRLTLKEDPKCATMWSNGVELGFNPGFVRTCTDLELKSVLMKLTLHAALGHSWRCAHRDLTLWNEACNYAVAPIIRESVCRLPGVFKTRDEFDGWCAEAIYRALLDERPPEQPEQKPSEDSKSSDGPTDPTADDEAEASEGSEPEQSAGEVSEEWRKHSVGEIRPAPEGTDVEAQQAEIQRAAIQGALGQGDLPGSLTLALAQTGKARVNWKEVLWQFAQASFSASDYTWARPNVRYLSMGLYLPRLYGKATPPMTAALDVSGSIVADPKLAETFLDEIEGVISQCLPQQLDLLYVDTAVRLHEVYEAGDSILPKQLPGGGGTSFVPAFEFVQDDPCCMVYLTDLEGTFPEKAPSYPVLWVVPDCTGKLLANPPKVPFGEVVVLPAFD